MSKSSNQTLVIVPTYNEAENIGPLLSEITRDVEGVDVLVVDDNSPDGTAKIVSQFMRHDPRVHLLNREKKEGLAAAYCAGFRWGLARPYQSLIEMDADFSHRPADLNRFIPTLQTHDAVIGCRYMNGGGTAGWTMMREGISRGGNLYARLILGLPYQDLTGGFNGWRRKVLETISIEDIRSKGYAFQVELKCRAHRAGFSIKEIPIQFDNRKYGHSKMSGSIVWEAAFRVLQLRKGA